MKYIFGQNLLIVESKLWYRDYLIGLSYIFRTGSNEIIGDHEMIIICDNKILIERIYLHISMTF